jgi:tetratricopeptide (TPR) repeat protein
MKRLCLNMIVKNEAARIERALASALPYISCYAIVDTGSTDDTIKLIHEFFALNGVPGEIINAPFENFSQARNAALIAGRSLLIDPITPFADYFLLMDADMELVVDDPHAFDNLVGPAYTMIQTAGAISYHNARLLHAKIPAEYIGVTHEYLGAPCGAHITGAHFVDHADGSNRVDKFKRDIKLLLDALEDEPDNGRYWFYLAQSYRDAGQHADAVRAYQRRVNMGGWEEETWNAQVNLAHSLKDQGVADGFILNLLGAYNLRPRRAEALYDLAKYFREKGDNETALLFIDKGLKVPRPDDILFVNDFVYAHGFKEEMSICGFYGDAEQKRLGAGYANELALSKEAPGLTREGARVNLFHYLKPLKDYCGSFKETQLDFKAPENYVPTNPSIAEDDGKLSCIIRTVNYTMKDGRYLINKTGTEGTSSDPIDTRNFMCRIDDDLSVKRCGEIMWHRPEPAFNLVTGLEDMRLYRDGKDWWANACVRELNAQGICQQVRVKLHQFDTGAVEVLSWYVMSGLELHEKNWMPFAHQPTDQRFKYNLETVRTAAGHPEDYVTPSKLAVEITRGGSQLIQFKGGFMAVVHESRHLPGTTDRYYQHRFAWFDSDYSLRRLSVPFYFQDKQIEFCAGLAYHPNRNDLVLSYGIKDKEAWVAQIAIEDVARMCVVFHEN